MKESRLPCFYAWYTSLRPHQELIPYCVKRCPHSQAASLFCSFYQLLESSELKQENPVAEVDIIGLPFREPWDSEVNPSKGNIISSTIQDIQNLCRVKIKFKTTWQSTRELGMGFLAFRYRTDDLASKYSQIITSFDRYQTFYLAIHERSCHSLHAIEANLKSLFIVNSKLGRMRKTYSLDLLPPPVTMSSHLSL